MTSDDHGGDPPPAFPFSPQEALTFMQKMWNPLGVPLPGFGLPGATPGSTDPGAAAMPFPSPAMLFAALDPGEIDRKIAELKVVESWLSMSLGLMQMSIKTLELQKASLEAISSAHQSMTSQAGSAARSKPSRT